MGEKQKTQEISARDLHRRLDGNTASIGPQRAFVLDVVRLASKVPVFPVERWFEMSSLAEARRCAEQRISWIAIFSRAYALAAADVPELRRAYLGFPWPRFHQSPYSVISVAVNRNIDGRDRLFFGRLRWPESKSLLEIQDELDGYTHGEVKQVFREQVLAARAPSMIRRIGWWWRLQARPSQRARRVGTGSISVLASQGVYNRQHPCVLSSSLSYGPMTDEGRMWVTLLCDHRIIDGMAAASAINAMHAHLQGVILDELVGLKRSAQAA
jgi:hypothetical protein